ncbi:hypothetical protein DC094_04130 [Pelagibaculum spongiae]|uniref:Uncharacterized protein n=1 Tax=Pelagibaculum spongiae TaxID=2080658 RepID=A0A2V1GYQ9_9GAMM|nr:hypothetical protein DC094_04130 [Pelagibaculum spongiae]
MLLNGLLFQAPLLQLQRLSEAKAKIRSCEIEVFLFVIKKILGGACPRMSTHVQQAYWVAHVQGELDIDWCD